MNTKFTDLLTAMNEKNWYRMLVCFTPGIILGKLSSKFSLPGLSIVAPATLIAGVSIYFLWPRLRQLLLGDAANDADAEDPKIASKPVPLAASAMTGSAHAALMARLVDTCGGSSSQALELVSAELAVDPDCTYGQALERAARRADYMARQPQ